MRLHLFHWHNKFVSVFHFSLFIKVNLVNYTRLLLYKVGICLGACTNTTSDFFKIRFSQHSNSIFLEFRFFSASTHTVQCLPKRTSWHVEGLGIKPPIIWLEKNCSTVWGKASILLQKNLSKFNLYSTCLWKSILVQSRETSEKELLVIGMCEKFISLEFELHYFTVRQCRNVGLLKPLILWGDSKSRFVIIWDVTEEPIVTLKQLRPISH